MVFYKLFWIYLSNNPHTNSYDYDLSHYCFIDTPNFLPLRAFRVLVEKSIFLFFVLFLIVNKIGMACGTHYVVHSRYR